MLDEKVNAKKVNSETSFQVDLCSESKKESEEKQSQANGLQIYSSKLLDRKFSKSLNDLLHQVNNEAFCKKKNNTLLPFTNNKNYLVNFNISPADLNSHKIARRRILGLLMLNAWRRQKQGFKSAQDKIESLNNKLEGFEMQVYVLKQLLNAEKKRVEAANENINLLSQKDEEYKKEKSTLTQENKALQEEFNKLLLYCTHIENALKNQENDIITSRLEAEDWEKQLQKEREKLKKMESEEMFLKDKVRLQEKVMLLKNQQIEQLNQINKELQQKLDVQIPLWDETMAQVEVANSKLKELEIIRKDLKKELEEKDKTIAGLKNTIANLEKKLQEEDERNGLLGKTILEKTNELTLVQTKFEELSKKHFPWSGGFIKMASFCAKIPVACICTVGSLLLPFPTSRF